MGKQTKLMKIELAGSCFHKDTAESLETKSKIENTYIYYKERALYLRPREFAHVLHIFSDAFPFVAFQL